MRRKAMLLFLVVAVILSFALVACSSDDGDAQSCESTSDCSGGFKCDDGICVESNSDLPSDGDLPDGDEPDGDQPDGDEPDGDQPDGDGIDGDVPDGDEPDGDEPDGDEPDGDAPDGDAPDGDQPDGDTPVRPECAAFQAGNNTLSVDGENRTFLLHLPTDAEGNGPWPVIFNWHGLGDTASNMANLLSSAVNNTTMPYILVTPEDTNLLPMNGLDWAIINVDANNKDTRMFDEILACLDEKYGIDDDHIHSVGFSAGGIMTDVLGVTRGDLLASTFTFSGAYFSNPVNDATLGLVNWLDLTTQNKYAQVMFHGGTTDQFNASILVVHFDTMGQSDVEYMTGEGHDIIHCNHGGGHDVPVGSYPMPIVQFFADHPKGVTDSPYGQDGLPSNFPAYCTFEEKN